MDHRKNNVFVKTLALLNIDKTIHKYLYTALVLCMYKGIYNVNIAVMPSQ